MGAATLAGAALTVFLGVTAGGGGSRGGGGGANVLIAAFFGWLILGAGAFGNAALGVGAFGGVIFFIGAFGAVTFGAVNAGGGGVRRAILAGARFAATFGAAGCFLAGAGGAGALATGFVAMMAARMAAGLVMGADRVVVTAPGFRRASRGLGRFRFRLGISSGRPP